MMDCSFGHQRYDNDNGKVRHHIDVIGVDGSIYDFFIKLEERIAQLNRFEHDIIDRHTGGVTLMVHTDNNLNKNMNCKFRERVNGKLEEISPQAMEGKLLDAKCVFKIHSLFEDHINLVAYEFVMNKR